MHITMGATDVDMAPVPGTSISGLYYVVFIMIAVVMLRSLFVKTKTLASPCAARVFSPTLTKSDS